MTILRRSRQLCLRGTFPAKVEGLPAQQQTLTLGIDATPIGVTLAEGRAHQIFLDLQVGRFKWTDYERKRVGRQTVGQWAALAEQEYWVKRGGKTNKSETTWMYGYAPYYKRLGHDNMLTPALVRAFLDEQAKKPKMLNAARSALKYLCKLAEVEVDWSRWDGIKRGESAERVLPTDEEIEAVLERMQPKTYRHSKEWPWVLGMIATFGIRPHEAWHIDLDTLRESEGEKALVTQGKTGKRWVYAYPYRWVEKFKLLDGRPPELNCRLDAVRGNRASTWAHNHDLPFRLYDLRHAYAVRMIRSPRQIRTTVAARIMGHSVSVHTEIYQRWINEMEIGEMMREANKPLREA